MGRKDAVEQISWNKSRFGGQKFHSGDLPPPSLLLAETGWLWIELCPPEEAVVLIPSS